MISHLATSSWHPLFDVGEEHGELLLLGQMGRKSLDIVVAHITFIVSAMQKFTGEKSSEFQKHCGRTMFTNDSVILIDLESTTLRAL